MICRIHCHQWLRKKLYCRIGQVLLYDTVISVSSATDSTAVSPVETRQFMDEALLMKEFDHLNVLCLVGVSRDYDGMPLVVLPYMKHGDLLAYIRNDSNVSRAK